jgi:hypothetical protein
MTFLNEGESDRGIRILGGIILLGIGWGLTTGAVGIALIVAGAIALVTGFAGWCPAYTAFGVSTRKTPVQRCRNCGTNSRG